jgi:hypothetical protein
MAQRALATFLARIANSLKRLTSRFEMPLAPVVHDVVDDADLDVVTASGGGVVRELIDENVAFEEGIGNVSETDELVEADESVDFVDKVEQEVLLEDVGMKMPRQAASYNDSGTSWN